MSKPLFLVRNSKSPLFESFALEKGDKSIILIQNGVLLTDLNEKGAKSLVDDAKELGIESVQTTDYDGMLDAILESSVVITI